MTTDELRANAESRKLSAECATKGPWRNEYTDVVPEKAVYGIAVCACTIDDGVSCPDDDAAFIAENDPPAVLASCKRDVLLADCIDHIKDDWSWEDNPESVAIVKRFAAMKVPK